ncbi:MAG: carbohydrate-binding protein [Clostridia bacterium]|nr:carbohydrate-binding protein [Clostridia bacterium]
MNRYYRTTKMMYAHDRANGEIVIDEFIQKMGVGHYDASWDIIKGEWYFAASDGIVKTENGTGFDIHGIRDGSYLYYPNISGMVQNARIRLHAVNPSGRPCIVEIREDSPFGHVLGCCPVGWTGTQDELAEIPCCLENPFGTHNLCFVFRGEGEDLLHFDGFRFEQIRP